ncbi:Gfo/Idh/MocA family protein [Microbacterium lacticum]
MTDRTDKAGWAVLGAGGISGDFLRALPAARLGTLRAVGARDAERAGAFAADFADDFPTAASGTYADVLARDDVDAVYIGTVHTSHRELSLAALAAGKAVLCEKPLGVDPAETDEILAAAAGAGLPLASGRWMPRGR